MPNPAERRIAFEHADAILRLEGFEKSEEFARIQEEVIAGRLTTEEALTRVIAEAKARPKRKEKP